MAWGLQKEPYNRCCYFQWGEGFAFPAGAGGRSQILWRGTASSAPGGQGLAGCHPAGAVQCSSFAGALLPRFLVFSALLRSPLSPDKGFLVCAWGASRESL